MAWMDICPNKNDGRKIPLVFQIVLLCVDECICVYVLYMRVIENETDSFYVL